MVSGQMTRGAAISMALLAIIVLALIVLLAWPTHSASDSPIGTDDLVGMVDLLTAVAVLRRCAVFIGNDTGLMHIAAASGIPTLGLFGPSPSHQYAPWGQHTALVRSTDPPEAMFGPGFDHRTTDTLMDGVSVDAAEAAAHRLWRAVASAAA